MRKNHSGKNLGSVALQIDRTSVLQVTRKQSTVRVQISHIRRLRRPYSPDTGDDVHVFAKVVTFCERECLPKNKNGAKNRTPFSLRYPTDLERSTRTVNICSLLIWNGSFSSLLVDLTSMWYLGQRPCHAVAFSAPNHARVS
jgi:hypothetical protein